LKKYIAVVFLSLVSACAMAGGFILQEENDVFGFTKTDENYTQGLLLQYVGDPMTNSNSTVRHLYGLRNIFYTPINITIAEPQPNDRPWAGLTALSYTTQTSTKDRFVVSEWMAGVVGAWSYSEQIQTEFHRWIGSHKPMGWSNQIPNEVVVNYSEDRYYRTWKLGDASGWSMDWANVLGYSLGTAFDYGKLGGILRAGWGLPNEYKTGVIMPTFTRSSDYSCYLFAETDGRAMLHNITLGGSLWQDGPQQDLKNLVVDAKLGCSLAAKRLFGSAWEFTLTFQEIWRSMEFTGQTASENYGSITLGCMRNL